VIAAVMLARGEVDAMLAGPIGLFWSHLRHVLGIIGLRPGAKDASTLHAVVLDRGPLFITDTSVALDPSPEEIAQTTLRAAAAVRQFGIEPRAALVSHSNFGSRETASSLKMQAALARLRAMAPDFEVDGEMQADSALDAAIRGRLLPGSALTGEANLLVMPSLDAANIAYNLVKAVTGAVVVGPILVGPVLPAHIVNPTVTTRGIVNMTAVACVDALARKAGEPG
jgi:malate dehydrogenase (oxaloacetate-decarboxylating)(NADP+)